MHWQSLKNGLQREDGDRVAYLRNQGSITQPMVNLDFKINDKYLILHTIANCESDKYILNVPREDVIAFQNYAQEQSPSICHALRGGTDTSISFKEIDDFAISLLPTPLYQNVRAQTEEALQKVKKEWENNFEKIRKIMKELTESEWEDNFEVYITHPSQKAGRSLGDNTIFWTYRSDRPNYNTIHLWHEVIGSYIQ